MPNLPGVKVAFNRSFLVKVPPTVKEADHRSFTKEELLKRIDDIFKNLRPDEIVNQVQANVVVAKRT